MRFDWDYPTVMSEGKIHEALNIGKFPEERRPHTSETLEEERQQIAMQPHIQVAKDAVAPRHPNVVRISVRTAIVFN